MTLSDVSIAQTNPNTSGGANSGGNASTSYSTQLQTHLKSAITTIGDAFANGTKSFIALTRLTKFIAVIVGLYFIMAAIYKLTQLSKNPQAKPSAPLIQFFCGIALVAFTSSIDVVMSTLTLGDNGPGDVFTVQTDGTNLTAGMAEAIKGVLYFMRLVGYIAFVRGWMIINRHSLGQGDAPVGRGIIHIIGGVAAINANITAQILANTFAPGMKLPI